MNNKKTNFKIGLYIRVSTEEQAENPEGSIRNQEERLKETIKFKNREGGFGEVVDVFVDRAKSGKDTNRPELQRMLSMIRSQEINLVMASELSRISRSIKDFAEIWELMQKNKCGFLSLRENFDTTTAAGEMVLYSLANIAQFERRQTSERISANFASRASRGLYNGGSVPVGYKLDPEKKGHLIVDEDQAEVVRAAFKAFLEQETLSNACKWLNKKGYKIRKYIQGGGRPGCGYFLIYSLCKMLRNKTYIGIRTYYVRGEIREVEGCWPAIVDTTTFRRVQNLLTRNHQGKRKPHSEKRFPYLLSGITFCEKCGDRMSGKSAHGNGGKIAYYEHSWNTKRNSTLLKKTFHCEPKRVLAKKLEPLVWTEAKKFATSPEYARILFEEAKAEFKKTRGQNEEEKLKTRICVINSQLDALAERLSQIPKTVSANPIFRQMEKLEKDKQEAETKVSEANSQKTLTDKPMTYEDFASFKNVLKAFLERENDPVARSQMVQKLISRVEISESTVTIKFHGGKNHFTTELGSETSPNQIKKLLDPSLKNNGSNSLTIGGEQGS